MIRICQIDLIEIGLSLVEPFQISSGTALERRILLVKVSDEDGSVGWGECVSGESPNYSSETIDVSWLVIRDYVAPRVFEMAFSDPGEVAPHLARDFRGHKMSKAAVEMAIWELSAQKQGVSLSRLLGGTREKIEVGVSLGIQPDNEHLLDRISKAKAQGYRKIKVKVKPGADVDRIRAVREHFGPDLPIMADANSAYHLDDLEHLKKLDEFGLLMIEQPLAHDDLLRHAELQSHLKTPVCLDETITGLDRAQDMITLGSGKIINIKPGRVGGFTVSRKIHGLCARRGVPVWCGGMLESGVGRAHNVALASLSNFTIPGDISPSRRYWEKDIVTPEWQMDSAGLVKVPVERAGMGVEVDLDRVENLTVRRATLEPVS